MEKMKLVLKELKKQNDGFKLTKGGDIEFSLKEQSLYFDELIYVSYLAQKYDLLFLVNNKKMLIHRRHM